MFIFKYLTTKVFKLPKVLFPQKQNDYMSSEICDKYQAFINTRYVHSIADIHQRVPTAVKQQNNTCILKECLLNPFWPKSSSYAAQPLQIVSYHKHTNSQSFEGRHFFCPKSIFCLNLWICYKMISCKSFIRHMKFPILNWNK